MASQRIDLGYAPRDWQRKVHRGLKRFSVVVIHRRGGKTVMAVMELVHAALKCTKAEGQFGYVGPLLKQTKKIAWRYLKRFSFPVPGIKINESELSVTFPNGATITLFGADNPDSLRGLYFDGVVLDEVADMKPETWGEILRPAIADRRGWAIFIGTVKGVNLLSEKYFEAINNPDEWFAANYTCYQTDALSPDEIESMRKDMSENQFRQEMLNDFSASNPDQLIAFETVQEAVSKHLPATDYEFSPRILGVDVARYGDDKSVIFGRQGLVAFEPQIHQGLNNMELAAKVAQAIVEWKPDAVFIDAGRGEGVIDRLHQLGHAVVGVNFGGSPTKPQFVNKRGEMWFDMSQWLKAGASIPNIPQLKIELCAPTYSYANAANKFELESKDDLKKRGLPSPDIADALALTFAFPVAPSRGPGANLHAGGHALTEYDPFA